MINDEDVREELGRNSRFTREKLTEVIGVFIIFNNLHKSLIPLLEIRWRSYYINEDDYYHTIYSRTN